MRSTGPRAAGSTRPVLRGGALAGAVGLLAACALPRAPTETHENFESTSTYSRTYAALDFQTCEAGRRTLLSQGYVISVATSEQVRGRKSFQPNADTHIEVEFNIVCAKEGYAGKRTIAFVNAVQDRFALKKSNNSASVGVPALGSLSLPFSSSDDSLVKVESVTITSANFYGRFFQLVERYLDGDPGQRIEPVAQAMEPVAPPRPAPGPVVPPAQGQATPPAPAPVPGPAPALTPAPIPLQMPEPLSAVTLPVPPPASAASGAAPSAAPAPVPSQAPVAAPAPAPATPSAVATPTKAPVAATAMASAASAPGSTSQPTVRPVAVAATAAPTPQPADASASGAR